MRSVWRVAASALLACAFGGGDARADIVPPGYARVSHSIRVDFDGAPPAGKALVMTGTWGGADVIRAGAVVPFKIGRYEDARLFLIDSADLGELAEVVAGWRPGKSAYEARKTITDRGVPCSDYLEIQRRAAETSPVSEVRLYYLIKADGASCASKHLRTELLSASGSALETQPGSAVWPDAPANPASPANAPSADPSRNPSEAIPRPSRSGASPRPASSCGSCDVGANGSEGQAPLLILAGAIALTCRRALRRGRTPPLLLG